MVEPRQATVECLYAGVTNEEASTFERHARRQHVSKHAAGHRQSYHIIWKRQRVYNIERTVVERGGKSTSVFIAAQLQKCPLDTRVIVG